MSTHFQQHSVLRLFPILTDIEVIANATEVASQMVTEQHLLRIVSVTSRSRAVNNEVFHLLFRHHLKSSHDNYKLLIALAHELTPSAVRAAMIA